MGYFGAKKETEQIALIYTNWGVVHLWHLGLLGKWGGEWFGRWDVMEEGSGGDWLAGYKWEGKGGDGLTLFDPAFCIKMGVWTGLVTWAWGNGIG